MSNKLVFESRMTTCKEKSVIKSIEGIIKQAINSIELSSCGGQILSATLASEIGKRLKFDSKNDYNVFVGENYETAIRYEKNSLITFKWDNLQILLLKCPGRPIYPSEDGPKFKIKDSKAIEEKYYLAK